MLCDLQLKNFAIVTELTLEFNSGMTVFTGETGAGKSILIDALNLVLGARADPKVIRQGTKRTEITASFDISNNQLAQEWLKENDLDHEDNCILRRVITDEGRSKNYINAQAMPLQALKEISNMLISIHGQHDQQTLVRRDKQRELLDQYAGHINLVRKVKESHQHWQSTVKELEQISRINQSQKAEEDLLRYQINELETVALEENEVEQLHQQQKQLANADEIILHCQRGIQLLTDNAEQSSILAQIQDLRALFNNITKMDAGLENCNQLLEQIDIPLQECSQELQQYLAGINGDPEALHSIENRLSLVHDLARKHQVKPENLFEHFGKLKEKLDAITHSDARIIELKQLIQVLSEQYSATAKKLTASRKKYAKQLAIRITEHMQNLGMPGGIFEIQLQVHDEEQLSAFGEEDIEFLVSANPGVSVQALAKVASGGELSRISLAIAALTAQKAAMPALVFDEVDTGIGGETADTVGKLLSQLVQSSQVFCVTHLAQVASQGTHHFQVSKKIEKGETYSHVKCLSTEERIKEIARMIGGSKTSKASLEHAQAMIEA